MAVGRCVLLAAYFGEAMGWHGAPDFDDIAEHMLAIVDVWNQPEMSAAHSGRHDSIAAMFGICFGRNQVSDLAARVLLNFDEFDLRLSEDRCEPDQYERRRFLSKLLRSEFASRGGIDVVTDRQA